MTLLMKENVAAWPSRRKSVQYGGCNGQFVILVAFDPGVWGFDPYELDRNPIVNLAEHFFCLI